MCSKAMDYIQNTTKAFREWETNVLSLPNEGFVE